MMKLVSVLVGAESIGQAIIRLVSAGKHILLADYSIENAPRAAKTLEDAGFECSTIQCDLAEFRISSRGRFISGADFLIDGGCTASYWYGDLQYLKATHYI